MLDFRVFTFLTVCESLNFTTAAETLNLSQPAVSQHIKFLENQYGCQLFDRSQKHVTLTPQGQMLFRALKTMANDERRITHQLQHDIQAPKELAFGVTRTVGEYAILTKLVHYIQKHPEINFHIHYQNTHTLLHYLDDGLIDFALVEGFLEPDQYSTLRLMTDEFVGVCAASHTFAGPVRTLSDLLTERLIVREAGSGTLHMLLKLLEMQNLSLNHFPHLIQVDHMHTIVELLCHDCGISFLYRSAVEKELAEGLLQLIPLEDFTLSHDFHFIWNRNSLYEEDYLDIFRELVGD